MIRQTDPLVDLTLWLVVATAALVVVGMIVGYFQIREQRKSTRLQKSVLVMDTMIKIDEMLNNEEAMNDRKSVRLHVEGERKLSEEQFEELASKVSGRFDRIGAIISVNEDYLKNEYLRLHALKTGVMWVILENFVIARRAKDTEYRIFFEQIGKECRDYWNDRHPTAHIRIRMEAQ